MLEKKRFIAAGIVVVVVAFGVVSLNGCKKSEPEPTEPAAVTVEKAFADAGIEIDEETKAVLNAAKPKVEQTVCPIMGNKINKEIFTEHSGQKVYFCCAMCIDKFKAAPEKYLSKLPQFGSK